MTDEDAACTGHPSLPDELRAVLLGALDRAEPALDRIRSGSTASAATTCAVCPVCAVLAALRGEHTELAVRLAEQAAGLLAVLRAALQEGDPAPPAAAPAATGTGRVVQHIPVVRTSPRR